MAYNFPTDSTYIPVNNILGNEKILINDKRYTTINEIAKFLRTETWYLLAGGGDITFTAANKFTIDLDEALVFIYKEFALKFVQVDGMTTTTSYGFVTNVALISGSTYEITFAGEDTIDNLISNTTVLWLPENNVITIDIDLFNSDVYNAAVKTDILTLVQKTPRKVSGKIIYAETACFLEDTGTNSILNLKNGANTICSLTIAGSNFSTINNSGLTINPLQNTIDGFLRVDSDNAGNKNTDSAILTLKVLPLSLIS